jgi:hypothetical protein
MGTTEQPGNLQVEVKGIRPGNNRITIKQSNHLAI